MTSRATDHDPEVPAKVERLIEQTCAKQCIQPQ